MGLFDKKLDYSVGSGNLPILKKDMYHKLTPPSTSTVRVLDFALAKKEQDAGKSGVVTELAFDFFSVNEETDETYNLIKKYLSGLRQILAPKLDSDSVQILARYIGIGMGYAIVERDSGLMIEDKTHPSISNAIAELHMAIRQNKELKEALRSLPYFNQVLEIAVHVGYLAQRNDCQLTPQQMFASVRPLV